MSNQAESVKPSKKKPVELAVVGVVGAFLSAGHSKLFVKDFLPDFIEPTKMALPVLSLGLYMVGVWVWLILKPQTGELINGRRQQRKAIKRCNKLLKDKGLTDEQRQILLDKRFNYEVGVIDSLAK